METLITVCDRCRGFIRGNGYIRGHVTDTDEVLTLHLCLECAQWHDELTDALEAAELCANVDLGGMLQMWPALRIAIHRHS